MDINETDQLKQLVDLLDRRDQMISDVLELEPKIQLAKSIVVDLLRRHFTSKQCEYGVMYSDRLLKIHDDCGDYRLSCQKLPTIKKDGTT